MGSSCSNQHNQSSSLQPPVVDRRGDVGIAENSHSGAEPLSPTFLLLTFREKDKQKLAVLKEEERHRQRLLSALLLLHGAPPNATSGASLMISSS